MKKIRLINNKNSRITIKHRTLMHGLVVLVAFWPFLFKLASSFPGALGYLKYLADGILLIFLVIRLGQSRFSVQRSVVAPLRTCLVFICYNLVVYLFQFQSPAYFLWGVRNNFRYYVAFFAFATLLDEYDVKLWFKVVDALFWINAVLSVIQFVFLGVSGDFLGGIFGITGGFNGYTMIFQSIVVSKSLLSAFNGTEQFSHSIAKCVASILVATMAEMKFFYFVFILLMLTAAVITRFSAKKLMLLLMSMIAVMAGTALLVSWFGFNDFFSLKGLWENATKENYSSQNDINRLSAIPTLAKSGLMSPIQKIFGKGLGNCDTSAFAICNTPFFRRYNYLHYTWFMSAMIFLETGYIGVVMYISFFILCFLYSYRQYKQGKGTLLYNQLAIIMSIFSCVLVFYNASLRNEAGYMMYFVLALPFMRQETAKVK